MMPVDTELAQRLHLKPVERLGNLSQFEQFMTSHPPANILLVEDDLGHARLIARNLKRAGLIATPTILHHGQEALDYLFKENGYAEAQHVTPAFMLLDLNLPGLNGHQVLERLKTDHRTRHIMIVVFTTTDDPQEIAKAYELGCNACLTKPVDYDQFAEVLRRLGGFLSVVHLPRIG